MKRSLNVPSGPVIIGAVGRLSQEKGFDVLIHAAHRLLEKGHELHLLIVGEGPERETLTKLISELRCQDRVRLLGHRSDVIELFHCMDIFVLSSRREALPNVVLEAMSMDVPVIATRVAGVPDVIQDQENGLLVTVDDPASLADALERLISAPSLRQRLSTAARSTVEQRFSFRERMNRMREIYERVLDARR